MGVVGSWSLHTHSVVYRVGPREESDLSNWDFGVRVRVRDRLEDLETLVPQDMCLRTGVMDSRVLGAYVLLLTGVGVQCILVETLNRGKLYFTLWT